jgi:citrate lyase subunit beta/citryl-CoA lyase
MIKTALGMHDADQIAKSHGVARLAFVSIDYPREMDSGAEVFALHHDCGTLVLTSRAARISTPIDGATSKLEDSAAAMAGSETARQLGFGGKLCIHAGELAATNSDFTPTAGGAREAERVVHSQLVGGVAALEGHLIDKPVLDQARRVLFRAQLLQGPDRYESKRP